MHRAFRGLRAFHVARGFTLLESMVVVAILAVLAALAGPNMVPVIERWRVRQAVEEMTGTIAFARSEAITRGGNVAVRRSTPDTAQCALAAQVSNWNCGWTVFDDVNGNGVQDSGEDTLRQSSPLSSVTATNASTLGASYALTRWGSLQGGGSVAFAFASARSGSTVQTALCLGAGGRARAKPGIGTCN